jgi:hypothetical protein
VVVWFTTVEVSDETDDRVTPTSRPTVQSSGARIVTQSAELQEEEAGIGGCSEPAEEQVTEKVEHEDTQQNVSFSFL